MRVDHFLNSETVLRLIALHNQSFALHCQEYIKRAQSNSDSMPRLNEINTEKQNSPKANKSWNETKQNEKKNIAECKQNIDLNSNMFVCTICNGNMSQLKCDVRQVKRQKSKTKQENIK